MVINHNITALNTYRQLAINTDNTSRSLGKLSSGLRINKASDDAVGLAISEKMRGQIRGLDQASSNAQNSISLLQTAEGALSETHSILQRMRELSVQSANDTNTNTDRTVIQKEVDQLASEITRISNTTEFNTQNLLNGGVKDDGISTMTFQIGANANQNLELSINAMDAKTLGISRDVNTATGVVAGDVGTVSFNNENLGSKVVDGAVITFDYTASSPATPAASAEITGGDVTAPTTDLSGISADATLTITIDGSNYVLDDDALIAATGTGKTITDLQDAISTAIGTFGTVGIVGGNTLVISSNTDGTGSTVSVAISGTTTTGINTAFGLSTENDTGEDAIAAVPAKVTLSDGTYSQEITISDPAAASLSVTSGIFSGVSITTATGANLSDIDDATDSVTVGIKASVASAASFNGGAKTADAVAAGGINVSTQSDANNAINSIQTAIETVSSERSKLGALQNRFEHTIANLGTSSENLSAAESRIRDVDMAKEMMEFTKNNILSQAAQAMLAQANTQPQGVLQLLR